MEESRLIALLAHITAMGMISAVVNFHSANEGVGNSPIVNDERCRFHRECEDAILYAEVTERMNGFDGFIHVRHDTFF